MGVVTKQAREITKRLRYSHEHGLMSNDIAVLDAGSYNAGDYLQISQNLPTMGTKVNIIGYPGEDTEK